MNNVSSTAEQSGETETPLRPRTLLEKPEPNLNTVYGKPSDAAEADLLDRLGTLMEQGKKHEDLFWEIGDLVNVLRNRFHWTFLRLAAELRVEDKRLIQYARTALAFPEDARRRDVPFKTHELTRVGEDRSCADYAKHTATVKAPHYVDALNYVIEQKKQGNRLTDQRKVTAALTARIRAEITAVTDKAALANQSRNQAILDKCYNEPCEQVISRMADGSVDLFHFDPPFGNYRRDDDGHLDISTSVGRTACENSSLQSAVATTVRAIHTAVPKLTTNGVILLWQASTTMHPDIAKAIYDLRLGGVPFIIWNKGRHKLGDPAEGIQYSTEVCYVLTRGKPLSHDSQLYRGQVIDDIPALRFDTARIEEYHQMEKPVELSMRFIKQLTGQHATVVDGFGCSGSFTRAAIRLNRKWTYCELNPDNFRFGTYKILAELAGTVATNDTKAA